MGDVLQLIGTTLLAAGAYFGLRHQVAANRTEIATSAAEDVTSASVQLWETYKVELEATREHLKSVELELLRSREERRTLLRRVARLEAWIESNTDTSPADINGEYHP